MVKIKYTLICTCLWLMLIVTLTQTGTLWRLFSPHEIDNNRYILQSALFDAVSEKKMSKERVIVGNKEFVIHCQHLTKESDLGTSILLPLNNLDLFGQAIVACEKFNKVDEYWIQASPIFFSNKSVEPNLGKQDLERWNIFAEDFKFNFSFFKKRVNVFFRCLKKFLSPNLKTNKKLKPLREINSMELIFVNESIEMKKFKKKLWKSKVKFSKVYLVSPIDEIPMDPSFSNKFNAMFTLDRLNGVYKVNFLDFIKANK